MANKLKPMGIIDLFNIKQEENELLNSYLNRFFNISIHIHKSNEEIFVDVFIIGFQANPFSESLIHNKVESMREIQSKALSHIEAEEVVSPKKLKEKCQQTL